MRSNYRFIWMLFLLLSAFAVFAQEEEGERSGTIQVQPAEEETSFNRVAQTKPVDLRKMPSDKIEELKKEDEYWYANRKPEKAVQPKEAAPVGGWFLNLLWIVVLVVFIGAVVWYLASSNVNLFRKPSREIVDETTDEGLADDIFSISYEKEIQKAVAAGNYRLAIRLWYLSTLKELANRQIIDYRHEKTNNDYVNTLHGTRYYRDFFRLTRNFEYTWYGQFALSPEAYKMMQSDFSTFKTGLRG
ncbi:MAG TPA: hypothetical protein VF609_07005 [Flavisolibacter sp.]